MGFLKQDVEKGVEMEHFTLRNLQTDRVRSYSAENAEEEIITMRFKLDLGIYPDKELQEEYDRTGLELYRFEIL